VVEHVDLTGTWLAAAANDELRRAFVSASYDPDGGWAELQVPGHWRDHDSFASSDGPVLYRREFTSPAAGPEERDWLVVDGIYYGSDIWLDEEYVGTTEGYFAPHAFEISDLLADGGDHVLGIEVISPKPDGIDNKRAVTGLFDDSEAFDTDWNAGGIWKGVRVERSGPVRIASMRSLCVSADEEEAVISLNLRLDAAGSAQVRVVAELVGSATHTEELPVAAGNNDVELKLSVESPELWWPHQLGDQNLHDLRVSVFIEEDLSDARELRTGLRQIELRNWIMTVNGERLFLKGANLLPTSRGLANTDSASIRRTLQMAKDAGLDLLRINSHVDRPEVYEIADELGLLLWQDLPLQRGYARGVRRQAVAQARAAVELLGAHPSIAIWCGHNESAGPTRRRPGIPTTTARSRRLARQELPTWNKSVLDRSVKRALTRADKTRPVIAHSGVWPHPPQLDGTDTHLWFGWSRGTGRDLESFARRMPRMVRFVSEFGAQSVPDDAAFCEPDKWPNLDWERLASRHGIDRIAFERYVPPGPHRRFHGWAETTRAYQAALLRRQIETLRRLKYKPTGGFAFYFLADLEPAISFGVIDHHGDPKPAYAAVREACRPVIVVADRLPPELEPEELLALDVHVVSDLRTDIAVGTVTATITWPQGHHRWQWKGDFAADSCTRVGTIGWEAGSNPGEVTLEVNLEVEGQPELRASNAYRSMIGLGGLGNFTS
jgi:beta-mannosidase